MAGGGGGSGCGVYQACLKQPTTNLTLNVGDSFTWAGNWSQDAPLSTLCRSTKATIHGQFKPVSGGSWTDFSSSTALKLISGVNPANKTTCTPNSGCSACTTNQSILTIQATSAAAGNSYYVRCWAHTSAGFPYDGYSTTKTITVNPLPATGGNNLLTLTGVT